MNLVLFALGVLLLILIWIMLHDTTHFETTEYSVTDPRIKKSCRAVVLADLHNQRYGRDNALLLEAIRKGKPDFVLIAGDMLTASPGKEFQPAIDLLGELVKSYPIYYGVGNHEYRLWLYRETYGDMGKRYEEALEGIGVREMKNETLLLEDYGIAVTGSQIHQRYYRRRRPVAMKETYLPRILGRPDPETFTILLAHHPDYFPQYAAWGADLTLSGHVHGGVVRVPFWNKGVISPAVKFFPEYDGGLFEKNGNYMLLSRGLGCHTIPVRLFNPGDLLFLEFCPGEKKEIKKKERQRKE